ncbi:MAG TPA: ECF transporter S component [Bacillota bacterium]|nr:ECF transporter S component [Bacillota bacterium]HPE39103.1 ECF transporter S component [Bacillota bacterium]
MSGNESLTRLDKKDMQARKTRLRYLAITGILAAMSAVLMYIEIPLPLMPPFLKYDLSDIPALFAAFVCGPIYGIIVELIKNLIHLPGSGSAYVGEIANFIAGSVFVLTSSLVFRRKKTFGMAILSLVISTVAFTIVTSFMNYYFILDAYEKLFHLDMKTIIGIVDKANPWVEIKSKEMVIMAAFVPFNLFKAISVSIVSMLAYVPLRKFLEEQGQHKIEQNKN